MKQKAKVYMLMGGELYEPSYCIDVYSNKENAKKALNRITNRQFYDPLSEYRFYQDDMCYWISEYEIKDLLDEKEN